MFWEISFMAVVIGVLKETVAIETRVAVISDLEEINAEFETADNVSVIKRGQGQGFSAVKAAG
jgi:hypothetical protein